MILFFRFLPLLLNTLNSVIFLVNPYLRGESRKRLVAKKRVKRTHIPRYNPYLLGSIHKTAVKKIGPYKPSQEKYM
ncbi:unnamed protein product [Schistosoma rodhaini]|nr:unnamed protein product [Schistosoma rodhaini]